MQDNNGMDKILSLNSTKMQDNNGLDKINKHAAPDNTAVYHTNKYTHQVNTAEFSIRTTAKQAQTKCGKIPLEASSLTINKAIYSKPEQKQKLDNYLTNHNTLMD